MALLVLFGVALLVLFFYFSTATGWVLLVGIFIATTVNLFAYFALKRHADRVAEIKVDEDFARSRRHSPSRLQINTPHHHQFRLVFRLSIYGFCFLCGLIGAILHKSGQLTPRLDALLKTAIFLAALVFCGLNLFWGIRERQTWANGFSDISRDSSPANYWVAIALWTVFTGAFAYGSVLAICKIAFG